MDVAYKANPKKEKLSAMLQMKWKCPPKLILDTGWHVACGEDSSEVGTQEQRESSVIEAVYPHLSAIPSSPLISPDKEGTHDDSQIPLISIIPIEELGATEMSFDTSAPEKTFNFHSTSERLTLSRCKSSLSPNPPTVEKSLLDVIYGLKGSNLAVNASAAAAAVAVAAAAVIESKCEIDIGLLIKFLSDPEMMKSLTNETRIGANAEPRFPSEPKSATYSLSSNSTPDPGTGIVMPVATDQPIAMKKSASDLGVTPAEQHNLLPVAMSQPIPMKELASDLDVTPAEQHTFLPVAMDQPIPMRESASDFGVTPAERHNFLPVATNRPIPMKESASDLGETPAKRARVSDSLPIQDLVIETRDPVIARSRTQSTTGMNEPIHLTAPTLSYNENQCTRLINQHGVPNAAPVWPLYPSFSKTNLEAASKPMVEPHPPPFFTGMKFVPSRPTFSYLNMEAASKPLVEPRPPTFFTGMKQVPPPPSFSKPNLEAAGKAMVEQHPPPFFTGMKMVPPPPSFSKPNVEAASKPIVQQHPLPFLTEMQQVITPPPSFLKPNLEAVGKAMVQHDPPPLRMELVPSPLSFSKPNLEAASKPIVQQHPPPFLTGMKPIHVSAPFSFTSRPYMDCMTDGYRALDHAGPKLRLGSNPSMPSALESNFTSSGTFHAHPFPSINRLRGTVEDLNYCKSLVKQHGEKHITNEDKLPKYGQPFNHLHELKLVQHTNQIHVNQKPCIFFNNSMGCRNGSNCPYMHVP